jgi:hypothetical protein
VKVTPTVLTVLPRRSATYTIEISRTTAAFDQLHVRVADLGGPARSQRAQPDRGAAAGAVGPTAVAGTGTSGSQPLDRQAGYSRERRAQGVRPGGSEHAAPRT